MPLPVFALFSGHFENNDAVWIAAEEGLAESYQKMLQIAAAKPGPYFVFSSYTRKCVASIDTSSLLREDERQCV